MRSFNHIVTILFLFIHSLSCGPYGDTKKELISIETAVGSALQAIEDADEHLLSMTFSHEATMICIGAKQSEFIKGWDSLRSYIMRRRDRVDKLEIHTRSLDIKLYDDRRLAWISAFVNVVLLDGESQSEIRDLRMTAILEKNLGRWMIVQAHLSSPLPI